MPAWLQILLAVVSLGSTVVTVTILLMKVVNRLDRRPDHLETSCTTVENQNRVLLAAFPPVISTLMSAHLMTPEQGTRLISDALASQPVSDILGKLKASVNPLSQADLDRLNNYVLYRIAL